MVEAEGRGDGLETRWVTGICTMFNTSGEAEQVVRNDAQVSGLNQLACSLFWDRQKG